MIGRNYSRRNRNLVRLLPRLVVLGLAIMIVWETCGGH